MDKLDQLERFFFSEYFTPEMTIQYLFRYKDQPQALDLLCKRLHQWSDSLIQFYCPQLCFLIISFKIQQLETFFLQKCAISIALFFNVRIFVLSELYWAMNAYSKVQTVKNQETYLRCMEMAMVNKQSDDDIMQISDQNMIETLLLQRYQEKEFRSNYFTEVQKFVGTLIKISLVLKQFPRDDRKHHLKQYMIKANNVLQRVLKQYKKGITIPISGINDDKPNSLSVVGILEKHQICFHTKKRVPYLILVETIDELDLLQYQPLHVQINNPDVEGFEQNLNDLKFEKQMAQIESEEYKIYHEALEKIMKMEKKGKRQSLIIQTIDQIVKKQTDNDVQQQQLNQSPKRKHSQNEESKINKPTRAQSADKNDAKSEQFIKDLPQILPANKLFVLNKFNKKNKLLWEETWEQKISQYIKSSNYAHFPSYKIRPLIIKGGDDLRQEMFAIQMMTCFDKIFKDAELNLCLRPYSIVVTSANSGIIEYIPNTMSIDGLKKKFGNGTKTLLIIYKEIFNDQFEEAQKNFIESLASYSLFTYLMQVKDRHNGNILINDQGHIMHIDFGYILQCCPGGVNFESSPFKLTQEYVELMKGKDSDFFGYFRSLMFKGLLALKKHVQELSYMLQIMVEGSDLPCFQNLDYKLWVSRFMHSATDKECMDYVDKLINQALYSWRTAQYDNFQKRTNGIIP